MKLESSDSMSLKENIESFIPYNIQEENDKKLILKYIDMFPDILTRDNKLCHFTASNWIVNKDRTKVLMAYHNIYNSWAWTGGHADGDEDLLRVSIKEASEETGINNLKLLSDGIFSIEILPVSAHIKRGHFVSSHLHEDNLLFISVVFLQIVKSTNENSNAILAIMLPNISIAKKLTKLVEIKANDDSVM